MKLSAKIEEMRREKLEVENTFSEAGDILHELVAAGHPDAAGLVRVFLKHRHPMHLAMLRAYHRDLANDMEAYA